ncbi:helix-turn-helix domain-containing protein [Nonomuraea salmonea]|uniref:TetR/AcrR family transcriptional regulator n=1 Tax=Nonomuraea salmonea TaxID=46181 RepID=UPI002FEAAF12
MQTTKTLREGSPHKRAAILAAARELFLTDGFDRSSIGAIAAKAGVSTRTVYDYFGDKQTLLRAVVEAIGQSLVTAVQHTLDATLTGLTRPDELEDALVAFAMRIATDMLDSAEYATLQRLVVTESGHLPDRADQPISYAPPTMRWANASRLWVAPASCPFPTPGSPPTTSSR